MENRIITVRKREFNTPNFVYFLEKSAPLIRRLLIGQGNSKQRLYDCEIDFVLCLSLDIPKEVEYIRNDILKRINAKPDIFIGETVIRSSFKNSLSSIRNSTTSKIIELFYNLYLETLNINNEKYLRQATAY